jgi:hypothetical protein
MEPESSLLCSQPAAAAHSRPVQSSQDLPTLVLSHIFQYNPLKHVYAP